MKLSKEKRNQFVLAVVIDLAIVAGIWLTLIRYQQDNLTRLREQKTKSETKLTQVLETINNRAQIEADLIVESNKLALKEEDMVSGDYYSTMISSITKFKQPYEVDIPQFTPAGAPADSTLLPRFPYKQFTVSVSGTAFFHDLGLFVADFENHFASSRILNLELAPASAQGPGEKDKLTFKMDIVSLVKPTGAR